MGYDSLKMPYPANSNLSICDSDIEKRPYHTLLMDLLIFKLGTTRLCQTRLLMKSHTKKRGFELCK